MKEYKILIAVVVVVFVVFVVAAAAAAVVVFSTANHPRSGLLPDSRASVLIRLGVPGGARR